MHKANIKQWKVDIAVYSVEKLFDVIRFWHASYAVGVFIVLPFFLGPPAVYVLWPILLVIFFFAMFMGRFFISLTLPPKKTGTEIGHYSPNSPILLDEASDHSPKVQFADFFWRSGKGLIRVALIAPFIIELAQIVFLIIYLSGATSIDGHPIKETLGSSIAVVIGANGYAFGILRPKVLIEHFGLKFDHHATGKNNACTDSACDKKT